MRSLLRENRCFQCGKLLLRGLLLSGTIEIRCSRCKAENVITGISSPREGGDQYAILFDYEGKILDASDEATVILGYTREELVGMPRAMLGSDISPADYEKLRAAIMKNIGPVSFDSVHRKKNGDIIRVRLQVKVLKSEKGPPVALVVAHLIPKDVDSSVRYGMMVNTLGQFLYVSTAASEALGYPWVVLIGEQIQGLFQSHTDLPNMETFSHMLAEKSFFRLTGVVLRKQNNTDMWCDLEFTPHLDDYGDFIGYDVIILRPL